MGFEPSTSEERVLSEPARPCEPWAAYLDQLFPVRLTNPWSAFKIVTTGRAHAQRLWAKRAEMLELQEIVHGEKPELWPTRHPTLVLHVPDIHYPACLGCTWLGDSASDGAEAATRTDEHSGG